MVLCYKGVKLLPLSDASNVSFLRAKVKVPKEMRDGKAAVGQLGRGRSTRGVRTLCY